MSHVTTPEKPVANDRNSLEQSSNTTQMVVIGIIVLAIIALAAYQFLGCSTCYAPI